jgi:hypothetical protein
LVEVTFGSTKVGENFAVVVDESLKSNETTAAAAGRVIIREITTERTVNSPNRTELPSEKRL